MLKKWVLSLMCCLTVLAILPACSSKKEAPTAESVQEKADEGKPLSRRDRARLEEQQQTQQPAGQAPAGGQ
jgi:hypothetical protein